MKISKLYNLAKLLYEIILLYLLLYYLEYEIIFIKEWPYVKVL